MHRLKRQLWRPTKLVSGVAERFNSFVVDKKLQKDDKPKKSASVRKDTSKAHHRGTSVQHATLRARQGD